MHTDEKFSYFVYNMTCRYHVMNGMMIEPESIREELLRIALELTEKYKEA